MPTTIQENKKENPTVTVIIPCHNHADMVSNAIKSVQEQDYSPINIVVVDDGSTDNPVEKIQEGFKDSDLDMIILQNKTPVGPSAARNMAIKEAWESSDLFMMLDADDLYLPGKVSKSVEKYLSSPESIGIVYTDAIIRNIQTKTEIHEFRQPFSRYGLEQECIVSNTPLVSKAAIQNSGGYDESMRTCEDWDLWLRVTESFVAVHIPEPLHVYHVTGKNSSDTVSKEVWQQNWARIHQRIQQRRNAGQR